MITPQALVPIEINARDDYSIEGVRLAWEVDAGPDGTKEGEEPLPVEGLPQNPVESEAVWDLEKLAIWLDCLDADLWP